MDGLQIFDCTLRDGGLTNNFFFEDSFVRDLYQANVEAGVAYMEMGYRASRDIFDENEFGKWKFCDEEAIREIVGDHPEHIKLAVMADIGRTDYRRDILPKKDSVLDMIRIATYSHTIEEALDAVEHCHGLGYETTVNIMAVSNDTEETIAEVLEKLAKSSVDVITWWIVLVRFTPIRRLISWSSMQRPLFPKENGWGFMLIIISSWRLPIPLNV